MKMKTTRKEKLSVRPSYIGAGVVTVFKLKTAV